MTRPTRTLDETWAIQLLTAELGVERWREASDGPSDKPDVTLIGPGGLRVACEITQVGRSEWHRWKNDPKLRLADDQLDEFVVPREPDLWLRRAIDDKRPKIPDYLSRASATEAWLLLHGGLEKGTDFFVLDDDEAYDLPLLAAEAGENNPFDRVYVASSSWDRIVCIFPFEGELGNPPDVTDPTVLKMLSVRTQSKVMTEGVTTFTIGKEFAPDRQEVLPSLDPSRIKQTQARPNRAARRAAARANRRKKASDDPKNL